MKNYKELLAEANKIKKEKQLTFKDLELIIGISYTQICRVFTEQTKKPNFTVLVRFFKAFGRNDLVFETYAAIEQKGAQ